MDEKESGKIREYLTSMDGYAGYDQHIPQDVKAKARKLCFELNQAPQLDEGYRQALLKDLLGDLGEHSTILPTFYCDYGSNIHMGDRCLVNYNCVILDTAPVILEDGVFIAPGTVLSCASHPVDMEQRLAGINVSKPICLKRGVWLGAHVTVLGGVTIGEGAVIAAGAVVTKDIPAGVVAGGVPCRVIREITEEDRLAPEEILF